MPVSVNGKTIPDPAFAEEFARVQQEHSQRRDEAEAALPPAMRHERMVRETKDRVIGRELLAQEAAKRYPQVPAEVVDKAYQEQFKRDKTKEKAVIDQRRAAIKRSLRVRRLLDEMTVGLEPPTEEAVFNTYMRDRQAFSQPESVHASHIVKHVTKPEEDAPSKEAIDAAYAELQGGADFAELCNRMSDCSGQSGDLGTFPRGQMVEAFEEVVFNLPIGEYSPVFKTEFGYHIALVHEKIPAKVTPLDEVRDQIRDYLMRQSHIDRIEGLIAELKDAAEIVEEAPQPRQ